MSKRTIRFQYCQQDTIIQCYSNELMEAIFARYVKKSKLRLDQIFFTHDGRQVNANETLSQVKNKDKEILILVNKLGGEESVDSVKECDFIKSFINDSPAIVEFLNDYCISLLDPKKGSKKIKLNDFYSSQLIDEDKIVCCKCPMTKAKASRNQFYYCFVCGKNFCPIHQNSHKNEHENIVDYSLKYFRCSNHKDKEFNSYCMDCRLNLCLFCAKEHEKHNTISFVKLFQKEETVKDFVEKIEMVIKLVDVIINWLQKYKQNLNVFLKINQKISENIQKMNVNYEILKTSKNFNGSVFCYQRRRTNFEESR